MINPKNFSAVLVGTFLFCAGAATHSAVITLPDSSFTTTEGDSQTTTPFAGHGGRLQWLYEGRLFPTGPITITGISFRVGELVNQYYGNGTGGTYSNTDFQIDISSTSKTTATIGNVFDDNHGSDRDTVRSGAISFDFPAGGTVDPFSDVVAITTPFAYDPSSGDSLLLDFIFDSRVGTGVTGDFLAVDRQQNTSDIGVAYFNGGYLGTSDAPIIQLTYHTGSSNIPEPSMLALMGLGLLGLGVVRRKTMG